MSFLRRQPAHMFNARPHTGWVAPEERFAVLGVEVPWSILDADRWSTLEGR